MFQVEVYCCLDIILQNVSNKKINNEDFVELSISKIIKQSIREYAFESEEEKRLISLNLSDDFKFIGNESLMIFVIFNLLKMHFTTKQKSKYH